MSTLTIHSGLTRPGRPAAARRAVRWRTGRAAPHPLTRLTRRGRLVAVVLLLALMLVLLTVFGPHSAASGDAGMPAQTRMVVVGPGDSLWRIASQVARPGQVRETVQAIEELNALSGPGVAVGQEIAVPVG